MRILGITIPNEKRLDIGLTTLYGIGRATANKVLNDAGVAPETKPGDVTLDQENAIRKNIEDRTIEGNLKREISGNIKRLKDIKAYRGVRHKDLTNEQEDTLRAYVEKNYKTEGDLKREIASNIKTLKDIKSYRGVRHMRKLPVKGQRTKTNSRTVRGNVRNTMGSGRRKESKT